MRASKQEPVGPVFIAVVIDGAAQDQDADAGQGIQRLALHEKIRVLVLGAGHDGGGDEDHGQPQGHQGQGARQEGVVMVGVYGQVKLFQHRSPSFTAF